MAKKRVKKKTTKKPKRKIKRKPFDSFDKKKNRLIINIIRFLIFFVIMLVLYFVTVNYVLTILFGLASIISGAIVIALLLVLLGLVFSNKSK